MTAQNIYTNKKIFSKDFYRDFVKDLTETDVAVKFGL